MAYQSVFKRYELKYMLTKEQKDSVLCAIEPYMALDKYGRTTIRNIYFDTDSYRLIRNSIDKPAYKEKLRIRSYSRAEASSPVFVELKKKYQSVVYKRRLSMPEAAAMDWVCGRAPCGRETQISKEIVYFLKYYETLHPAVFLSHERKAYYSKDGSDFMLFLGFSPVPGLAVAAAYMYRTRYTKSFVITLALLLAVVCIVIMLVNGNVGTGVAVAGAFSLVRFRSVPGTAKEICMLFLAMGAFDDILAEYTTSHDLVRVKTTNMGSMFRLTYNVSLKDVAREKEMIDELRCRNGNLEIYKLSIISFSSSKLSTLSKERGGRFE